MTIRTAEDFSLNIVPTSQDRINSDMVREILTPEQLKKCMKTIEFDTFKTTRIKGEKPKFQMPNLGNATIPGLIDMLGKVREEIKDLQKLEGIYKEAVGARIEAEEKEAAKLQAQSENEPNAEELSKLFKQ